MNYKTCWIERRKMKDRERELTALVYWIMIFVGVGVVWWIT